MNRIALVAALLSGISGCQKASPGTVVRADSIETRQDPQLGERDLLRDLEASVLENYLQLTLGNMEAYADSIARNREVVLVGVQADDLAYGKNPSKSTDDRRPFKDRARPKCGRPENPQSRSAGSQRAAERPADSASPNQPKGSDQPDNGPSDQPGEGASANGSARAEGRAATSMQPDAEQCARIASKALDLHLYRDGSVAWIADEIAYRVPHNGREASIPLRFTSVLVRDIDRWVVVMEHTSYALPFQTILALAEKGELSQPEEMDSRTDDRGRSRLLRKAALGQLSADRQQTELHAAKMARKYGADKVTQPDTYRLDKSLYLTLMPFRGGEYRGPETFDAPSITGILSTRAAAQPRVEIDDYRLTIADNKRVAWMATNLSVTVPVRTPDGQPDGQPDSQKDLEFTVRGTFVFAFDSSGWNIVQSHLSVPVTESQLSEHIFGDRGVGGPPKPNDAEIASNPESGQ